MAWSQPAWVHSEQQAMSPPATYCCPPESCPGSGGKGWDLESLSPSSTPDVLCDSEHVTLLPEPQVLQRQCSCVSHFHVATTSRGPAIWSR